MREKASLYLIYIQLLGGVNVDLLLLTDEPQQLGHDLGAEGLDQVLLKGRLVGALEGPKALVEQSNGLNQGVRLFLKNKWFGWLRDV